MPCYSPITLYKSRLGRDRRTLKWPLVGIKDGYKDLPVDVPCGRCLGCRLERSRQWAVRCVHESQMHENNCFITLTYSEPNLTWGENRPTLYPRDLQLFLKRLRKKYGNGIRFFACGEYGEQTLRPHYHACIFGLDFPDKKLYSSKNGNNLYTSNTLNNIWSLGNCLIGSVSFESAAYVARYIMAKKLGNTSIYYNEQSIEPEFSRMSRRPGVGKPWLDKYQSDVFPADRVVIRGGNICHPPKYYSNQFELSDPVKFLSIKNKRKTFQNKNAKNNTDSQLQVRYTIKLAQIKTLTRSL